MTLSISLWFIQTNSEFRNVIPINYNSLVIFTGCFAHFIYTKLSCFDSAVNNKTDIMYQNMKNKNVWYPKTQPYNFLWNLLHSDHLVTIYVSHWAAYFTTHFIIHSRSVFEYLVSSLEDVVNGGRYSSDITFVCY